MFWDWTFYRTCCILLDPQVGPTPIVSVKDGRTEFIVLLRIIIVRDFRKNEYWRPWWSVSGWYLKSFVRWSMTVAATEPRSLWVFVYLNLCIWIFVFEFVYLNFGICSCVKLYLCFHSSVFVRWSMTVAATEPRSLWVFVYLCIWICVFVYLNFGICSCAIAFMYS